MNSNPADPAPQPAEPLPEGALAAPPVGPTGREPAAEPAAPSAPAPPGPVEQLEPVEPVERVEEVPPTAQAAETTVEPARPEAEVPASEAEPTPLEPPPVPVAEPAPRGPGPEEKLRLELARQQERGARLEKEIFRQREELRRAEEAQAAAARELTAVRGRSDELASRLLRTTADCENLRRRSRKEVDDARKYGTESLLKDLLPVLDNLERALQAGHDDSPVVVGVRMVQKLFLDILGRHGLAGFECLDQPFDPARHEAAELVERPGVPGGIVVSVFQKGYLLQDRLVRPAMVIVSKALAPVPPPVVEVSEAAEAPADAAALPPVVAEPALSATGAAVAPPPERRTLRPVRPLTPLPPRPVVPPPRPSAARPPAASPPAAQPPRSAAPDAPPPQARAVLPARPAASPTPAPGRTPTPPPLPVAPAAGREPEDGSDVQIEEELDSSPPEDGLLEIAGILVGPAPADRLAALELAGGVEVLELRVPSPGARSGLCPGDLVTGVGNRPVHDPQDFVRAVRVALRQRKGLKFRFLRPQVDGSVPPTPVEQSAAASNIEGEAE